MKLPGSAFLSARRAVKAFESQEPGFRDLVFYSEGAGDWPHLGPVILDLLEVHDRKISYLTSDTNDPGLGLEHENVRGFNIGSGTARTVLFARIECRQFVMTLPDLGNLWLKRSVHPVQYVYAFHSFNSTHTSYRKGAFDNFDTILCVGPHHVEEIRCAEQVYGRPAKELVDHGSTKLDTIMAEAGARSDASRPSGRPRVVIAPTWGDSSLIEQPLGRRIIRVLLDGGVSTVLRLHPMTTRRLPQLIREIEREFGSHELFRLEENMSAVESWLESDAMVTDWSGAATEYAFGVLKPVIYIDTPPKRMNPSWAEVGLPSFEDSVRSEVGTVVEPGDTDSILKLVRAATAEREQFRSNASEVRGQRTFNPGSSVKAASAYLNASLGGR